MKEKNTHLRKINLQFKSNYNHLICISKLPYLAEAGSVFLNLTVLAKSVCWSPSNTALLLDFLS